MGTMAGRSVHVICTYLPTGTLGEASGKNERKVRQEAFDNMAAKLGKRTDVVSEQPTADKVAEVKRRNTRIMLGLED